MDLMGTWGYEGYVGLRITCRGMRDCGDMRDMRDGPPPRNRAVGSAVFWTAPPNPRRAEKRNGKRLANQKGMLILNLNC